MSIRFPLRLIRRGPGWYLIDGAGHTIAAMTADHGDAQFILRACNSHGDLLDLCRQALGAVAATSPVAEALRRVIKDAEGP